MKGTNLGEFEELLLLIAMILQEEAYVLRIREELLRQVDRQISMGALHTTLSRLEKKGLLRSAMGGATPERGGRRKRIYELTASGKAELSKVKAQRVRLWDQVPNYAWNFSYE